jgi:hypothetical protein
MSISHGVAGQKSKICLQICNVCLVGLRWKMHASQPVYGIQIVSNKNDSWDKIVQLCLRHLITMGQIVSNNNAWDSLKFLLKR